MSSANDSSLCIKNAEKAYLYHKKYFVRYLLLGAVKTLGSGILLVQFYLDLLFCNK